MENRKRAFTLIELLIAVAIIGILAAIAVPNFLNAQTRAKVASIYGSMKSAQTAIGAYIVDWGWAPIDHADDAQTGSSYVPLTTPVAYINSIEIFRDPFHTNQEEDTGRFFTYGAPLHVGKFDDPAQFEKYKRANIQYFVFSWGPDRVINWPWSNNEVGFYSLNNPSKAGPNQDGGIFYSSSNGLHSQGDILSTDSRIYQ